MDYGKWKFQLSSDGDYVNITDLADKYHVKVNTWLKRPATKTLLKYLEERDLEPLYDSLGVQFLRVELLSSLVSPPFITKGTPPVTHDIVKELVDDMISIARSHCGKEFFYIYPGESEQLAHAKTTVMQKLFQTACERLQITKTAEGELARAYRRAAPLEEINHILRDLALKIPEAKNYDNLHALVNAMTFETSILSTKYRMVLAMLMVNESSRRSLDRTDRLQLRRDASYVGIAV